MTSNLERFKAMFLDECEEHLKTLEASLTRLSAGASGRELIDAVFRAVHSIKGGAGMLGFVRIVPFAHMLETAFDRVRQGQLPMNTALASVALRAADCLADLIAAATGSRELSEDHEAEFAANLARIAGIEAGPPQPAVAHVSEARPGLDGEMRNWRIVFRPHAGVLRRGNDPLPLLRQLRAMGEATVTADLSRLPPLADIDPTASFLAWTIDLTTAEPESVIKSVFEFVEDDCDLEIVEVAAAAAPPGANVGDKPSETTSAVPALPSIRVDLDRIDRLINLAGEIAISQALVAQLIDQSLFNANPRLFQELSQLLQHTQTLQDSVMAIRAQPIRTIFERMPRLVRELAEQTGKRIVLRTSGETTEIDKTVIEQLSDPIMHMIRNAADHGLEAAEERAAAGKPAEGLITLHAEQRGSRIVIEVGDDGRGLDRAKILRKAVARNLVPADAEPSPEEIDNLIFQPGFSTAEKVTDISGRGVGMDVVRRNIQKLGGRVGIRSEPGHGSRMILTLPLTLAVTEGMIVRAGNEFYVIPMASIYECRAAWAREAGILPGAGAVLNLRGRHVALLHLAEVFGMRHVTADTHLSVAVIAEIDGGKQIALVVDEIVGQQQVVIKSINDNLDPVAGIAGATILGDGHVALILDPTEIARLATQKGNTDRKVASQNHQRSNAA